MLKGTQLRLRPERLIELRSTRKSWGGRACVRGLRITVSLVLNLIANGKTTPEILSEYPDLEGEDIRQALHYAAWLANEEVHPLTLSGR